MRAVLLIGLLALGGCARPPEDVTPPEPTLRKLTRAQYRASLRHLLGPTIPLPSDVPSDLRVGGYAAVGAGVESIAPRSVEQYEVAALDLAIAAMADEAWRAEHVPCSPSAATDSDCAGQFLRAFGRRAWRRPLSDDEAARLVAIADTAGETLEDFWGGLAYALGAQLMSPHFLYRAELGEDDPDRPGKRRFTSWEMASRLSYLLWGSTPDDALLDAAERGDLVTDEGIEEQASRLLSVDEGKRGVAAFFSEMLLLEDLRAMTKDGTAFPHWGPGVAPAAKEGMLRTIIEAVFDEDGDYRDLLVRETAFVDANLAPIYGMEAPPDGEFVEQAWPENQRRRGLLGQVGFLALQAHPTSSSATLRGRFVMERLLCQVVPLPPPSVNTQLPEPTASAPTLRDRVAIHLEVESCATCHRIMDPIGLAFENYDALGQYRETEGGATIDPSGEFADKTFDDAWELGGLLRNDPNLPDCLVDNLHRYAVGHAEEPGEVDEIARLADVFADRRHRVLDLVVELVLSPAFRDAGEIEPWDRPAFVEAP